MQAFNSEPGKKVEGIQSKTVNPKPFNIAFACDTYEADLHQRDTSLYQSQICMLSDQRDISLDN